MNPAKRKKLLRMKQKALQGVAKLVQVESPTPVVVAAPVELPKEELKLETLVITEEVVAKEEAPVVAPAPVSKKKKSS
jgi:hypothetical protein